MMQTYNNKAAKPANNRPDEEPMYSAPFFSLFVLVELDVEFFFSEEE